MNKHTDQAGSDKLESAGVDTSLDPTAEISDTLEQIHTLDQDSATATETETKPSIDWQVLWDRLKAWPQYLLPHALLSSLMYKLTRSELKPWKNNFIRWFIKQYKVDLSEALIEDPEQFPHFNAFFTRALKPEARPMACSANTLICPVDGAISQIGDIEADKVFQAKGRDYDLQRLLAGNLDWCESFRDGKFATIYLSPKDYHRIHMPQTATVTALSYVPGRLFSVSPATTRVIPALFARNERLLIHFHTAFGEMMLIMVGAIFVAGMETVFTGEITPPHNAPLAQYSYRGKNLVLQQGDELGRFNMGSTVILLFQKDAINWLPELEPGQSVKLGEVLGKI